VKGHRLTATAKATVPNNGKGQQQPMSNNGKAAEPCELRGQTKEQW